MSFSLVLAGGRDFRQCRNRETGIRPNYDYSSQCEVPGIIFAAPEGSPREWPRALEQLRGTNDERKIAISR